MTCTEWESKIDPYIDSELPAEEAARFGEHLHSCAACSSEALGRMKLKKNVLLAGRAHFPTPAFRARVRNQVRGRSGTPANAWVAFGLATAMLIFVSFAVGRMYTHRAQTRQVVAELADLHVSNLAASSPVDVVSTDRHTVKPWFQGKLPFTFNLPELSGTEFTLVGGRLIFLEHQPTALLTFKYRGHFLSLFILQDRSPFSRLDEYRRLPSSFDLESWRQGGLRYCLISDTSAPDAKRLATLLKTAATE